MRTFWTILAMTFICFIINFPKELPISFHFDRINFNHTFYRPDFKFKVGEKNISKISSILKKNGLRAIKNDTGGNISRTVSIDVKDGNILIKQQNMIL